MAKLSPWQLPGPTHKSTHHPQTHRSYGSSVTAALSSRSVYSISSPMHCSTASFAGLAMRP